MFIVSLVNENVVSALKNDDGDEDLNGDYQYNIEWRTLSNISPSHGRYSQNCKSCDTMLAHMLDNILKL